MDRPILRRRICLVAAQVPAAVAGDRRQGVVNPAATVQASARTYAGRSVGRSAVRSPAIVVAAALIATPLLKPHGPAHVTPADVVMAVAIVSVIVWAGTTGARLHLPYAVPMSILIGCVGVGCYFFRNEVGSHL